MERPEYLEKLVDYFKTNLKKDKGYTMESLKWALLRQGYSRTLVDKTIAEVIKDQAKEAPLLKAKPIIRHEMLDEHNLPVRFKKPWWKRIFGF